MSRFARTRLALLIAPAMTLTSCSSTPEATATTTTTTTTTAPAPPPSAPTDGCNGPLAAPVTERYRDDVDAADAPLVSLDVYRRTGATQCPAILWVHGGAWTIGDKRGKGIDTKAAFAGEIGAVLVSLNYRLATADGTVRWPVMGDDVAAAVAWVLGHASELGIDPTRVTLMGHSAGGQLVAITATNPRLLTDHGVSPADLRCVVTLDSAAYDLTDPTDGIPTTPEIFGTDPAVLADASPTVQARAHPDHLPDMLVVTRGVAARQSHARAFADAVAATGATVQVLDASPYSHEQVNTEVGDPTDTIVTPPLRQFLESCFA